MSAAGDTRPGCIAHLPRCAHTRHPKTLPLKYVNATRSLAALHSADLALCYSTAVDRHLAANEIGSRMIIPLFPTTPEVKASGHDERRRVLLAEGWFARRASVS